jgi:hypothetical protein
VSGSAPAEGELRDDEGRFLIRDTRTALVLNVMLVLP